MNRVAVAKELVRLAKELSASKETDAITQIAVSLTRAEALLTELVEQMSSVQEPNLVGRRLRLDASKSLKSAMFLVRDSLEKVSSAKKLLRD